MRSGWPVPGGVGRPRVGPDYLVADKAYSSRANRVGRRARRIAHTIPERNDQRAHRRRGGRPVGFCPEHYRRRNQVERGFARRKQLRAVATLYDKLQRRYEATLTIASLLDWLPSQAGPGPIMTPQNPPPVPLGRRSAAAVGQSPATADQPIEGMNVGGRLAWLACSNAYPSASNPASS